MHNGCRDTFWHETKKRRVQKLRKQRVLEEDKDQDKDKQPQVDKTKTPQEVNRPDDRTERKVYRGM